jgi:hypothetical protein
MPQAIIWNACAPFRRVSFEYSIPQGEIRLQRNVERFPMFPTTPES